MGVNLANDDALRELAATVNAAKGPWKAEPLVPGAALGGDTRNVTNPADRLVRHARRSRAHATRRRSLLQSVRRRDQRARQPQRRREAAREGRARRAVDLGQALRAAPALRSRQARTRARGADAENPRARAAREKERHRHDRRRRRSRSPRALARHHRRRLRRFVARRLERLRPRRAGVPEARAVRHRLARRNRAQGEPPLVRAPRQRRVLGFGNQALAGTGPVAAIPSTRANRTPTCRISPARAACSTRARI